MNYEEELNEVKEKCLKCEKCSLSKTRTNVVFSDGIPNNKLVLVGEAPGFYEDKQGKPFVGKAGQLLDKILGSVGLTREKDIYIMNTIKCRPPENRVPTDVEKATCEKFLTAQIDIMNPKAIIFCGATSLKSFWDDKKVQISKVRGKWFDVTINGNTYPAMAVFHPSYLLRNHSMAEGSPRRLMHMDLVEINHKILGKKVPHKKNENSLHNMMFGELTAV